MVSREVVRSAKGTITAFAFDEGQGLSEHTAPYDALVYLLDGEAEITIAGEAHQVRQGEMILMPAGQPHGLHAVRPFTMVLTMLRSARDAPPDPES